MRWLVAALFLCACASPRPEPVVPAEPEPQSQSAPPTIEELAAELASSGVAQFVDKSDGEIALDYAATIRSRTREVSEITKGRVLVVALPMGVDPNSYAPLHGKLALAKNDVLFVFSAKKRHLHCQGIPKEAGKKILETTSATFYKDPIVGALATLDEVGFFLHSSKGSTTM